MQKTRKMLPIVLSVIIVILAAVVVALLIFMKNQPVETRGGHLENAGRFTVADELLYVHAR